MRERPATTYFTGLARDYAHHRPSYPPEAITFALDGLATLLHAADVGCGTGISTRLLADRGVHVIGIEPNREMLEQARSTASTPLIEYMAGTAEDLPLEDASVDLVLCAQSFHWFDAEASLSEFFRITKVANTSRAVLMWNLRDDSDPFTRGYNEVVQASQEDAQRRGLIVHPERPGSITLGGYFANPRTRSFPNPQRLNLESLLGRIRSASYFPPSGPLRDELESRLGILFSEHQHHGFVTLHHRTEVTIADRAVR